MKYYYSLFLVMLLLPLSALATDVGRLTTLLNAVHTMQADFEQTIYDNRAKPIQISYGTMAIERPGKFRWDIKKPIPQLVIANQAKLWIYDPDLQQVTIRILQTTAGDTPALLLSHVSETRANDFTVVPLEKNTPGWEWFSLKPKKKNTMFESIRMGFEKSQMHEMYLQDSLGHTTKVKFKNIKMNAPITSSLFVFKVPPHVDVIDETHHS
jgi:outer membrane lipoprotein carrier protein